MRPKRPATPGVKTYKYATLIDCEEAGNHLVKPTTWPPTASGAQGGEPTLGIQCELCGCWCVVDVRHATTPALGIDVELPESARPATAPTAPTAPRENKGLIKAREALAAKRAAKQEAAAAPAA